MENIHKLTKQTMELVGQTVRNTPSIPTIDEMKRCLELEFEELFEKAQAMGLEGSFHKITATSFIKRALENESIDQEEYEQYQEILNEPESAILFDTNVVNLVEVFDAALDQRVVAAGTDLCFGFQNCIVQGDAAVWRSNMSKFDMDYETACNGATAYREGKHPHSKEVIDTYIHSTNGYHIIKRSKDHKYLKSINYSAVDLRSLVGDNYDTVQGETTEIPYPVTPDLSDAKVGNNN